MDIKEAGLCEGISEVIATTRSASGVPNAAPIGILTREDIFFVKLYKGSQTISNVQVKNELAANVTMDAVLFVNAAFATLSANHFSLFHSFPVLKEANSWLLFNCNVLEERREYFLFQLTPIAVKLNRQVMRAINRGLNAVIEAAILATRYGIIEDEREKAEMKTMIERYGAIVEKCGGHREKEAMSVLYDFMRL
ncbi:MAG: DUF447 family protein [Euryarchaeota archaeon]|nr:DUF447 family protein [Euryarchaeota archaeon]